MPSVGSSRSGARAARVATRGVARRLGPAAVLAAAVTASAMCTHGDIAVIEPPAKPPPSALTLTILPGDPETAAQLGWQAGIPGAQVILAPSVKPRAWGGGDTATGPPIDTLVTDSAGHVSVPALPAGWYYVEVRRWLAPAEAARLSPGADLIGFMTQQVVERGDVTLSVPGSHRRSIVISEASNFPLWDPVTGGNYTLGGYLELANNSDTTVYLDGLVIGLMLAATENSQGTNCATMAPFDNDPLGVWVWYMDSLPGTGHDYPLAPGAVAVLATDAIDHRPISPLQGLDLSHANFDMWGNADAKPPGIPESIPISTNGVWDEGHGMIFSFGLASAIVVALPVDTTALPKVQAYQTEHGWVQRIPRDHILDLLWAFWPHLVTVYNNLCPIQVSSALDRQPAPLWWTELPDGTWQGLGAYSIQRKVAYTRADGRKILQDTRTTEADFFVGLRTGFQLP